MHMGLLRRKEVTGFTHYSSTRGQVLRSAPMIYGFYGFHTLCRKTKCAYKTRQGCFLGVRENGKIRKKKYEN